MMKEMILQYEAFAKHAHYMEKLSIDQNRVVLKDNKRNRIAKVLLKEGSCSVCSMRDLILYIYWLAF